MLYALQNSVILIWYTFFLLHFVIYKMDSIIHIIKVFFYKPVGGMPCPQK